MASIRHYHHHYRFSYTTTFKRHLTSIVVTTLIILLVTILTLHVLSPKESIVLGQVSIGSLFFASFNTLFRLFIAYLLTLLISIPVALIITSSSKVERVLLPIMDIIQSVPVLAFFPLIVIFFIKYQIFDGAAIFVLFLSMLGTMVFSIVGGLKAVPEDIKSAATIFGAKSFIRLFYITIPAVLPFIVTGSLLSWSAGWNITIVAEVIHNYIPGGTTSQDLYGLGSLIVNSFSSGQNSIFLASIATMILLITLLNLFVWQRLIHLTERYRFD